MTAEDLGAGFAQYFFVVGVLPLHQFSEYVEQALTFGVLGCFGGEAVGV